MNIDFCNGKVFKVMAEALKEKIMKECDRLFGFQLKRGYFPGPQPVAIEKKDISYIKANDYVVCEKTDGERGILILINIDKKPMCILINRNNEFLCLNISFKKEVFEGSIFDGEIIRTKKGDWNYLIHDCMVYNGRSFMKINHELRYSAIIDFIIKRYTNKKTDVFNIKTKIFYRFISSGGVIETWNHINKTTENKIDGLIFTPVLEDIKLGRQYTLYKWKEPENNTIDFLVKKSQKKLNLYYEKKGSNELFRSLLPDSNNHKVITKFLADNDIDIKKEGVIIEFKYSPNDSPKNNETHELFKPYKIRLDKDRPNGEITLQNTLKNIEEAITITEIV
jgi:hypothetical protein